MYPVDYKITAPSAILPVSIEEARQQLRNEGGTFDDDYIESLIWAAAASIEQQYGLALIETTVEQYHTGFPDSSDQGIYLRIAPLLSVESIAYTDTAGAAQTVTIADYTNGGINGYPFVIPKINTEWPTDTARKPNAVTVTYTAGFGDAAADVPKSIKQAILLMVADLYQNREDRPDTMPRASEALLRPYYRYSV